jgi:mono/diheme cytochrome c family protein
MQFRTLLLLLVSAFTLLEAQELQLPKNPLKGQIIFEEKKCVECHGIGGYGGTEGPDLSRELYFGSVLELASTIWNHTPQMNRKFRQLRMERPQLSHDEMLELFGFLYYLRYLGEPGGAAKGKKLLETKECIACHTVGGKGGTIGPDFDQMQHFASPLYVVQAMWNHGPAMQEKMKTSGIKFPTLSGQDIADITVYIRQASSGISSVRVSPGDPAKGKELFKTKSCNDCHQVEGKAKKFGPNLSNIELRKGVTEVASSMWNHGPTMLYSMKKRSINFPRLEGSEMADIIAYLYFLGFEDKPGDPARGNTLIQTKGCADCHARDKKGAAPDLSSVERFDSPVQMVTLMWNHATEMEDLLISQNKEWPQFDAKEMRDVYAYLKKATAK